MDFSLKPNIDSRVFTESALAEHVSCGFTSCPVQFEGVFTTDWIGLLSIALNKVSAVIHRLWQPWTACYIFHTITCEAALKNAKKKKNALSKCFICFALFFPPPLRVRLTSLPTRSSWFSTMPHGAMPMVQILPLDLEAWSFSASPTWRITPSEKWCGF